MSVITRSKRHLAERARASYRRPAHRRSLNEKRNALSVLGDRAVRHFVTIIGAAKSWSAAAHGQRHRGEAGDADGAGAGRRQVDDAGANEWPGAGDPHGH